MHPAVEPAWGEGAALSALPAFHQLIVKRTAVAGVRDRGKRDALGTKKGPFHVAWSSRPRVAKFMRFGSIFQRVVIF